MFRLGHVVISVLSTKSGVLSVRSYRVYQIALSLTMNPLCFRG